MRRLKVINKSLENSSVVVFEQIHERTRHAEIPKDTLMRIKVVFTSFKDVSVYGTDGEQITSSLPFKELIGKTRLVYKNELKLIKG